MSTLAKIVPLPKDTYSASATYNSLDIVRYNYKSWICKVDGTTGVTPASGDTWMLLNSDGASLLEFREVSTGTASNLAYQALVINSTDEYIINGTVFMEDTKTLSTSQDNVFTFSNAYITTDSCIDVFTSTGMAFTSISVTSGSCVITYPKADSAVSMKCKIYIRK